MTRVSLRVEQGFMGEKWVSGSDELKKGVLWISFTDMLYMCMMYILSTPSV